MLKLSSNSFWKRRRIGHGKNKLFEHKSLYCQKSFLQVYFTSNPVLFYFFHFGNHPPLVSCNTSSSVLVICSSSSIYAIKTNKNKMNTSRILLFGGLPFYSLFPSNFQRNRYLICIFNLEISLSFLNSVLNGNIL